MLGHDGACGDSTFLSHFNLIRDSPEGASGAHVHCEETVDCARQCCHFRYFHSYSVGRAKPAILGCLVITDQMGQQLVFIFSSRSQ